MWLFLLSLLATESVQSASISYPFGSYLTYSSPKSTPVHGYLRYLDNYGTGGLVGYNTAQPVYAVRQIKYFDSSAPKLETMASKNSEGINKSQETYLRTASLQQYQHLKSDIDALKAEGKEPSAEKLSKLQMLEKIAFTSDFSLIAELPEVKSTLHELEGSISNLYQESVQQSAIQPANRKESIGEIKTYVGKTNIPVVVIEETPEQKQARENHLRIYNEQIAHLKQLELEHQKYLQESILKSKNYQSPNHDKPIDKKIDNSKALTELELAQEEHFRLWNEAKLSAEQTGYENGEKGVQKSADQQQISKIANDQNIYKPREIVQSITNSANQEHSAKFEEQSIKASPSSLNHNQQINDQAKVLKEQIKIPEQHQVMDTPEVVRAREEHLRIVNEAILRSQQENVQHELFNPISKDKEEKSFLQSQTTTSPAFNYRSEQSPVEETAEVKKAREEHLRLVKEANQRAQFVEQQEFKYKQNYQVPILKSQYEQEQHQAQIAELSKARLENDSQFNAYLKEKSQKLSGTPQQQLVSEAQISGETAEVQSAREEHLRIFNSIKAHAEQELSKESSRIFPQPQSDQKPILDFAIEEERLLELERLREAERLQKEHQLLEFDRLREAERLTEEKRQMDAELMRLRLDEEQRLEMERLLEEKRLQQEREELKAFQSGEYQEIIIQNETPNKQEEIVVIPATIVEEARSQQNTETSSNQNHEFANNPFLKESRVPIEPINRLEHSVDLPSSNLKAMPVQIPSHSATTNAKSISSENALPNVRYVPSSHQSGGSKHQYIKDDKVKHNYNDSAGYLPADTAVALIALEKATNDHFRAHELALEQLRIARIQNQSIKDCN